LPRDDPRHIIARLWTVLGATLLSPLSLLFFVPGEDALSRFAAVALHMGLEPRCNTLGALASPVLLVLALFMGPCALLLAEGALAVASPEKRAWLMLRVRAAEAWFVDSPLRGVRALVAAPLSEEVVFRGCVAPLWALCGLSHGACVGATCGTFGLAHVHHYWERRRGGATAAAAAASVALQLSYTSAFGAIAAHAFLRGGSLGGAVAAHALANWFGLPSLAFATEPAHSAYGGRHALLVAHAAGVALFFALLANGAWRLGGVTPCVMQPT